MYISKYKLRKLIMKELEEAVYKQMSELSDPILIDDDTFEGILRGLSEKISPRGDSIK